VEFEIRPKKEAEKQALALALALALELGERSKTCVETDYRQRVYDMKQIKCKEFLFNSRKFI